jgi:uncharacterized protein YgiM (DUF1202 family)
MVRRMIQPATRAIQLALLFALVAVLVAAPAPAYAQTPAAQITRVSTPAYTGPGTGFTSLGTLRRNEVVPVLGVTADAQFWQVNTQFGVAYILARDVSATNTAGVPVVDPGVFATVTRNGRSYVSPGPDATRGVNIRRNQQFYLEARTPDNNFVLLRNYGWASTADLRISGDLNAIAAIGRPQAIVTAGFLNVRTGPGLLYVTIGTLSGGDVVNIVGRTRNGVWLQVETGAGVGWINSIYARTENYFGNAPNTEASAAGAPQVGTVVVVRRGTLNVRTGPNVAFPSIGTVQSGSRLPLLGMSPDGEWWYVDTEIGMGWITKQQTSVSGPMDTIPVINP